MSKKVFADSTSFSISPSNSYVYYDEKYNGIWSRYVVSREEFDRAWNDDDTTATAIEEVVTIQFSPDAKRIGDYDLTNENNIVSFLGQFANDPKFREQFAKDDVIYGSTRIRRRQEWEVGILCACCGVYEADHISCGRGVPYRPKTPKA